MKQYAGIYLLQPLSTCFECPSHPSSGENKTVTATSGTGHSIWAATFLQRGLQATLEDTRNIYRVDAVNKYLHTVSSCWILLI